MNRKLVLLNGEDAVFSASATTEGGHVSLRHVPGAALLGWVASRLYADLGARAWDAFHSGAMRFGNAYPLTVTGEASWPIPNCLRHPKADEPVVAEADGMHRLNPETINERHAGVAERAGRQFEAFRDGSFFIAASGAVARPLAGRRLKTAIEAGTRRAAAAQLFGYEHLRGGTVFAALLEGDADAPFDPVVQVLKGARLTLGRSRRAEYGGRFACGIEEVPGGWLPASSPVPSYQLVLWLLSDLAAVDRQTGAPTLEPGPADLGLGEGCLVKQKSFIQSRVYAPWNGKLRCRDSDRPVIRAGSILAFDLKTALDPAEVAKRRLGLHIEQGLGMVAANPPLLDAARPVFAEAAATRPRVPSIAVSNPAPDYDRDLIAWISARAADRAAEAGAGALATTWIRELETFENAVLRQGGSLPSRAQWGRVRGAAEQARDMRSLGATLFDGANAICREGDPAWASGVIGPDQFQSVRQWLRSRITAIGDFVALRTALQRLAGDAGQRAAARERAA
ncbi:MAG: hypothetical protein EPO55_00775 [Reyranella sp.]|uniref:hypothetical protein n=1 Tax=Reyranella sp. TaxID=1929291 RepID=UPI0011F89AB9|nr:hypothetical protein [Reyranella sp.]TAJ42795.1 MAG: hypothetical protein EPO55_00775 [Reyranella sp.]